MLPTKNDFYNGSKPQSQGEIQVEYAEVAAFSATGEPLLRKTGETTTSPKIRPKIKSYDNPSIGDRVLLINDIIIGTWSNN